MQKEVHRSTGKLQFKSIVGSSVIKQWGVFLSNGCNKTELIRFLVRRWQSGSLLGDVKLYVAYDESCFCIEAAGSNTVVGYKVIIPFQKVEILRIMKNHVGFFL